MRLVKWAVIVSIGIVLQTVATAYYVSTKMTYKFSGFIQLLSSISQGDPITAVVKVTNPTIFNVKLKDLEISVVNPQGVSVLSFLPVTALFRSGVNDISLTFDKGNVLNLLGDYISKNYTNYTVIVKGKLGGYLPLKYKYKLSDL